MHVFITVVYKILKYSFTSKIFEFLLSQLNTENTTGNKYRRDMF